MADRLFVQDCMATGMAACMRCTFARCGRFKLLLLAQDAMHLCTVCREPLAITVSATDQNDSRLWVSAGTGANYGTCVDIWAPGASILSASNTADNATEYVTHSFVSETCAPY